MPDISVCMVVKDEERLLPDAIESVLSVATEIVVGVDSRSSDDSRHIAVDAGARVHTFDWQDSFAAARNTSLERATCEWILFVDADETFTPYGVARVREVLETPRPHLDGYAFVVEQRSLDGTVHRPDPGLAIRLWRNSPEIRYVGRIHEQLTKNGQPLRIGAVRGEPAVSHAGNDTRYYFDRGKHERNMRLFALALEDNPNDWNILYHLARQYASTGQRELSRQAAERALALPNGFMPDVLSDLESLAR